MKNRLLLIKVYEQDLANLDLYDVLLFQGNSNMKKLLRLAHDDELFSSSFDNEEEILKYMNKRYKLTIIRQKGKVIISKRIANILLLAC